MKKYKTIIIDGKSLFKKVLLLLFIIVFLSLISILLCKNNFSLINDSPEKIFQNTFPAMQISNQKSFSLKEHIHKMSTIILGFDIKSPNSIIEYQIPIINAVNKCGLISLIDVSKVNNTEKQNESSNQNQTISSVIPPERQAPIKETDLSPGKSYDTEIKIGNETSYNIDIPALLSTPTTFSMKADGPKILIVHTHATESYSAENATIYDIEGSDRSENCTENVVKVGDAMLEIFNKKGIDTIHDRVLHDVPSFNGSYAHSLASIENYIKKYPSIQIVLDIHRDSIIYQDGTKARPVTKINGKKAAQLMFVVGTDQKGLYHPNWQENIKNAIHFQNQINKKYPSLMRHINLRGERFNGHTTGGSMIIEVGSSGNSLSEAIYGASLAAECIADYLISIK